MSLLDIFKGIIDNAPLDVVESLSRRTYRYCDEYNHVTHERLGMMLDVDGHHVVIKINTKDRTTIVREVIKVRSENVHVPIPETDLTQAELAMFKDKVVQCLSL